MNRWSTQTSKNTSYLAHYRRRKKIARYGKLFYKLTLVIVFLGVAASTPILENIPRQIMERFSRTTSSVEDSKLPKVTHARKKTGGTNTMATARASFPICGSGRRVTCTVDGDTVWYKGEKIRLVGIDAPEVSNPSCNREAALGRKATRRLSQILSRQKFTLMRSGKDRYGRTLGNFLMGGQPAGNLLVQEGLAKRYRGGKARWCV